MINDFNEQRECSYKGEKYSVRDNGAVYRHALDPTKPRRLDNQWTFGRKNKTNGYMTIGAHRIHIIVATAFLGEHDSKKDIVDHIDTNRCNNRVDNLRWLTRLENALNNPATRKKIEFLCGGDIQRFIDNPHCLQDKTGSNQDVMWMRTVSKEEAKNAYERVMQWAQEPNKKERTKGKVGEWIYMPRELFGYNNSLANIVRKEETVGLNNKNNDYKFEKKTSNLFDSLTPYALQKAWKTPTEFPLCPIPTEESPLLQYLHNMKKDATITENKYGKHIIDDFALNNDNSIIVRCHADKKDTIKPFSLITITYEDRKYIHEGTTFFEEKGALKHFTLALGLEWTGEDGIDTYAG